MFFTMMVERRNRSTIVYDMWIHLFSDKMGDLDTKFTLRISINSTSIVPTTKTIGSIHFLISRIKKQGHATNLPIWEHN